MTAGDGLGSGPENRDRTSTDLGCVGGDFIAAGLRIQEVGLG